jgi:hypothetical protein
MRWRRPVERHVYAETLKKELDSVMLPMATTTYAVGPLAEQGQWFCNDEHPDDCRKRRNQRQRTYRPK